MKLKIEHQSSYSRGELLLRTFFGWLYIAIPHGIVLIFVCIWACILNFLAFWVVLFTGKYPKSWFEFQIKLFNWSIRLNATLLNLIDGYPAIGVNGTSSKVSLEVPYPNSLSRGLVLIRLFFGAFYVMIPHMFCLFFRMILGDILIFIAWLVVLFTGNYPESWHSYQVGTFRWMTRINLYMGLFTDEYPKFSGKE